MKTLAPILDITAHKRMEEDRKRYEEKLSALNAYSRGLNMAKSMEEIYELTLDAAEKTLGFEFADILIIGGKMLCLVSHRGHSKNLSLELPLDGDKGITVRAARTGRPVFVQDVSKEDAYVEGGLETRSELAVPIKIGHSILGVLNVESKELDAFDEKDQRLLEILASHAATAISNLKYAKNLEAYAREIRESQQKFERLFMDNPEAAVYLDPDFQILDVNPRFEELFGYSLDEIKDKNINDVVVPKDKIEEAKTLDKKAGKGYVYHDTLRKRKDGALVPMSISAASLIVEGQLVGYVGLYKDITERKQMEEKLGESEEKYRKQFEEALDAILLADAETGIILDCNRAASQLVSREKSELVGKHQRILHPPQEINGKFSRTFKQHLKEKEGQVLETRVITKKGEIKDVAIKATLFELRGKKILQGIFRDITERKKAEEASQRAEEQARALNTYSRSLNMAESMEEIYRLTLDAMEKTLGFEHASFMVVDKGTLCIVDQLGYPKYLSIKLPLNGKRGVTVKASKTGRPVLVPDTRKERGYIEGMPGICSEFAVPVKIGHRVLGVLNVESKRLDAFDEKDQQLLEILASHAATAISNLKYAKNLEAYAREILESQQKFERLFRNYPEAADYLGPDFHILDVNPRFEELFGYSLEEIKDSHINEVLVPRGRVEEAKMLDKKAGEGIVCYDTVRKRKDGSLVPVSISAAPITVEGKLIGTVGLYKDITERKRFEDRLSALNTYSRSLNMAESMEEIYRVTLDVMEKTLGFENASFMVVDKGTLCIVDQRGYPESLSIKLPLNGKRGVTVKASKTGRPVLVPDTRKERDYVEGMPGMRSELDVPVKIGNKVLGVLNVESKELDAFDEKDQRLLEILASHAATAISNLKYAKNLEKLVQERTKELRETHEQLLKAERLAAIGELAASVGHDLRNPLTGIGGAVYYLKMKLASKIDEKSREMLNLIENDIQYSNKIVSDLLDFSREIHLHPTKTNAKSMIKEALSQIEAPKNVKILDSTRDNPRLFVDVDHMKRVFGNLITNAIEAMPNGGKLEIKSEKIKNSLKITFKDTGTGVPKSNLNKIFTPLFTTKAKGVGLGLSICKRIIDAHGGSIDVESKEGMSTCFTVTIPIEEEMKNINR